MEVKKYDDLTIDQRKLINRSWFVFGNYGKKHNDSDHKFIQFIVENRIEECPAFEDLISEECKEFVTLLMADELEEAKKIMNK